MPAQGSSKRDSRPKQFGPARRYLTIEAAADYIGVSTKTIRRRIADGSITGYRAGPRTIRIDAAQLDQFMRPIPTAVSA